MPKLISITGPESTGKSTLSQWLSGEFPPNIWVDEYARNYLTAYGPRYDKQDLDNIARQQITNEKVAKQRASEKSIELIFLDSDAYVLKVWYEVAFGSCPDFVNDYLASNPYSHSLLCDIDLPWEEDILREHPHQRQAILDRYKACLSIYDQPYTLISGLEREQRKQSAKQALHLQGFIK